MIINSGGLLGSSSPSGPGAPRRWLGRADGALRGAGAPRAVPLRRPNLSGPPRPGSRQRKGKCS